MYAEQNFVRSAAFGRIKGHLGQANRKSRLTLHRLGLFGALGRSLKTTNGLESVNALVEERCAKVDHWQNSSQRQRWLATALLDIEPRLRKVMGYRHLPTLRAALQRALKIDTTTSQKTAA